MPETIEEECIVTAVIAYGDDDVIVRMLGAERGRIGAFAAKAKRSTRRFVGGLNPLARGQVTLTARRSGSLFRLERAELALDPAGLGADVLSFGRASYLAELVEKLLPEAEPAPEVFADFATALEVFSHGQGSATLLRAFELRLLLATGYLPDLDPALTGPVLGFDPVLGRFVEEPTPAAVPFNEEALAAARTLVSTPLLLLPEIPTPILRCTSRIFATHLRQLNVGQLKTIAFLKGLDADRPG